MKCSIYTIQNMIISIICVDICYISTLSYSLYSDLFFKTFFNLYYYGPTELFIQITFRNLYCK